MLAGSLTGSLTHWLTHRLTHSPAHSLAHSPAHDQLAFLSSPGLDLPRDGVTHSGLDPPASANKTTPLGRPTDQSDPGNSSTEAFLSGDSDSRLSH